VKSDPTWLCYSPTQGAYHIESVSEGLAANQRAHATGRRIDFVPLAQFDTRAEASDAAAQLIRARNRRAVR
jgi:hypothetical protein